MPIPSNQITHVEMRMQGLISGAGSSAKNTFSTFHFRRTTTVNVLSKANIDAAFQTAIGDKIVLALNLTWSQLSNTVRFPNDALDAPTPFTHVNVGARAGDRMASFCAAFLLLQTGLRGKSYRGGSHLGPLSEADSTSGTDDLLNAGALTRFGAIATPLLAGFTDANGNVWVPSVVSRVLSQLAVNPTTVVANDVISVLINKRIGRMKNREVRSVY